MKWLERIIPACFLLILLLCGTVTVLKGDRAFSDNENRPLKTRSTISSRASDGSFQRDLNEYLSDQFLLRDVCTAAQSRLKRLTGRRDIGGAYLGKQNHLFQRITDRDVDPDQIAADAKRYARLQERTGLPLTVLPVPSAGIALSELLPAHAQMYDYDGILSLLHTAMPQATVIDTAPVLRGSSAYFGSNSYYRTDHHWTTEGAYLAYCRLVSEKGREAPPMTDFSLKTVTADFRGTQDSRVLDRSIPPDTIKTVALPDGVRVVADGKEIPFYNDAALETKDKYSVFLSGNHGVVEITNPQNPDGKTLLLIKDSFANCLAPFLIYDYARIVMVDERYCMDMPAELCEQYGADELLVVKEAAFF
ncbi:MAG: hypothetical protein IJL52_10065 [Clostridia bacterium]|nr:hypothetical protein [Clostridia bacterium]